MDCGRFKRQCDNNRAGWFDAKCHTWAGSRTSQCQQCYRQARSLQLQCEQQGYEDARFDDQSTELKMTIEEWGKWILIGIAVLLFLFFFLKK